MRENRLEAADQKLQIESRSRSLFSSIFPPSRVGTRDLDISGYF
jgi:hypothetical protein